MLPWVKEQITEAWNSRKNSKSSKKNSLNSAEESGMSSTSVAESFTISVISVEGNVTYVSVSTDFTFEEVKSLSMELLYGHDKSKLPKQYRLVHATQLKPLADDKKLSDEVISESDELMLVKIRPAKEKENLSDDVLKGPSPEEITNFTKHLHIKNRPKPTISSDIPIDTETRRILVTLVQASAKILMYSPDAVQFYDMIKEKLEIQLKPPSDPKAVKYLVDMGFIERKALRALRLKKMNVSEALEWLVEHQDDSDEEADIEQSLFDSILVEEAGPSTKDLQVVKQPNLIKIVNLLLETYLQYHKLDFRPDLDVVDSLQEMGFEKKNIYEALKVTGNNQANACAWLLGERNHSLENIYEGMDPSSPIYKAIMTNPQIQLSLTNPKMLLAYLSMLETPTSTTIWMKDPQVSPVINQIFKTFNAEKHALHVNNYENS